MLENLNDFLSIFVLIGFTIVGIYMMFAVSNKHHINRMQKREDAYYQFIEDSQDEEASDDDLFFE